MADVPEEKDLEEVCLSFMVLHIKRKDLTMIIFWREQRLGENRRWTRVLMPLFSSDRFYHRQHHTSWSNLQMEKDCCIESNRKCLFNLAGRNNCCWTLMWLSYLCEIREKIHFLMPMLLCANNTFHETVYKEFFHRE